MFALRFQSPLFKTYLFDLRAKLETMQVRLFARGDSFLSSLSSTCSFLVLLSFLTQRYLHSPSFLLSLWIFVSPFLSLAICCVLVILTMFNWYVFCFPVVQDETRLKIIIQGFKEIDFVEESHKLMEDILTVSWSRIWLIEWSQPFCLPFLSVSFGFLCSSCVFHISPRFLFLQTDMISTHSRNFFLFIPLTRSTFVSFRLLGLFLSLCVSLCVCFFALILWKYNSDASSCTTSHQTWREEKGRNRSRSTGDREEFCSTRSKHIHEPRSTTEKNTVWDEGDREGEDSDKKQKKEEKRREEDREEEQEGTVARQEDFKTTSHNQVEKRSEATEAKQKERRRKINVKEGENNEKEGWEGRKKARQKRKEEVGREKKQQGKNDKRTIHRIRGKANDWDNQEKQKPRRRKTWKKKEKTTNRESKKEREEEEQQHTKRDEIIKANLWTTLTQIYQQSFITRMEQKESRDDVKDKYSLENMKTPNKLGDTEGLGDNEKEVKKERAADRTVPRKQTEKYNGKINTSDSPRWSELNSKKEEGVRARAHDWWRNSTREDHSSIPVSHSTSISPESADPDDTHSYTDCFCFDWR